MSEKFAKLVYVSLATIVQMLTLILSLQLSTLAETTIQRIYLDKYREAYDRLMDTAHVAIDNLLKASE